MMTSSEPYHDAWLSEQLPDRPSSRPNASATKRSRCAFALLVLQSQQTWEDEGEPKRLLAYIYIYLYYIHINIYIYMLVICYMYREDIFACLGLCLLSVGGVDTCLFIIPYFTPPPN